MNSSYESSSSQDQGPVSIRMQNKRQDFICLVSHTHKRSGYPNSEFTFIYNRILALPVVLFTSLDRGIIFCLEGCQCLEFILIKTLGSETHVLWEQIISSPQSPQLTHHSATTATNHTRHHTLATATTNTELTNHQAPH